MTRKPLFWILLVLGVSVAGCCMFSGAILWLGASDDSSAPTQVARPTPSGGSTWKVAGEVARGASLTQSLPGGRWLAQYGSSVDMVVARSGVTAWVQTNTSGSLYELVFDDDGSYVWTWAANVTLNGQRSSSLCTERGSWSLSGSQLTLQPESQAAEYSNGGGTQEKTDQDLSARRYELVDLTLETLNDPKERIPGVLMQGPVADWDTTPYRPLSITLQRLED